ncbi:hypothetical protein [Pararhizobium sp. PWRC1-1]|uniref:hypothetical protein n=1 Tax=Pararhizobium sp. PWRC1-1 TaxID=2804566 RepID=UPI003CF3BE8C
MTDGTTDFVVIVTKEALQRMLSNTEDMETRLLDNVETFGSVADFKIEHGKIGEEGRIWLHAADITEWMEIGIR